MRVKQRLANLRLLAGIFFSLAISIASHAQPSVGNMQSRASARPATVPAKVNFYVIPLRGPIISADTIDGRKREGHLEAFDRAVKAARTAKAQYVIIYLDTPGGRVDATLEILDCIIKNPELHFVAAVKTAGSAGAMIAMACREIFMTQGATIGAAVTVGGPQDIPADAKAKYKAWEDSRIRVAVQAAGHNELFIQGMRDLDLLLVSDNTKGVPSLSSPPAAMARQFLQSGPPAGVRIIKRSGEILSLTSEEAVETGLCKGIVPEQKTGRIGIREEDIGKAMGMGAEWTRVGTADTLMRSVEQTAVELDFRETYADELAQIDSKLARLQRQLSDAQTAYASAAQRQKAKANFNASPEMVQASDRIRAIQDEIAIAQAELAKLQSVRREMLLKVR